MSFQILGRPEDPETAGILCVLLNLGPPHLWLKWVLVWEAKGTPIRTFRGSVHQSREDKIRSSTQTTISRWWWLREYTKVSHLGSFLRCSLVYCTTQVHVPMCPRNLRKLHTMVTRWAFNSRTMPHSVSNLYCNRKPLAFVKSRTTSISYLFWTGFRTDLSTLTRRFSMSKVD